MARGNWQAGSCQYCSGWLLIVAAPCCRRVLMWRAGAPVRLPVQDVFKGRQGGTCVGGKLEAGALRPGSKVLVVPGYVTATVKGLEVNSQVRDALEGTGCPAL